jgi:hypothetical protein
MFGLETLLEYRAIASIDSALCQRFLSDFEVICCGCGYNIWIPTQPQQLADNEAITRHINANGTCEKSLTSKEPWRMSNRLQRH